MGNLGGVMDSCLIFFMMGSSLSTIAGGDLFGEDDFPDLVVGIVVIWFLWFKIGGNDKYGENWKRILKKRRKRRIK